MSANKKSQTSLPQLTEIEKEYLRLSKEIIFAKINGKQTSMTRSQLMLTKQFETGMGGSPHAQNRYLKQTHEAEVKELAQIEQEVQTFERFKKRQEQTIKDMEKKGEPTKDVLYHPDDFVIDPNKGAWINGPITQKELGEIYDTCKLRDTYLLQDVLERRLCQSDHGDEFHPSGRRSAFFLALLKDRTLPERFRLEEDKILPFSCEYRKLTKRELLKTVHRAWKSIGQPKPRGWVTLYLENELYLYEAVSSLAKEIKEAPSEELSETIARLMPEIARIVQSVFQAERNKIKLPLIGVSPSLHHLVSEFEFN
ncbi:MAG: hypothetical protein QNJ29_13980 [Rhizobiaceae bacterium]|nr:hypothetical protein [Rhizobiaceae bacterium]